MIIIITLLAIALLTVSLVSFFAIKNLLSQITQLEEGLQIYVNNNESLEDEIVKHYEYFIRLFSETLSELQRIDKRGSFSSDDEVGFSFRVIITAIENVKLKLESIKSEEPEKTK